jgi:hypothetical protein
VELRSFSKEGSRLRDVAHGLARSQVALVLLTLVTLAAPAAGQGRSQATRLPKGFTENVASLDGVKIHDIGGKGPVVVWLHGYTQTSHM